MKKKLVKDYDKFNLRFPDGMRDAIAARAKFNGRSMNAEIIQLINSALNHYTSDELTEHIENAKVRSFTRTNSKGEIAFLEDSEDIAEYIEEKTDEFKLKLIEAIKAGKIFITLAP